MAELRYLTVDDVVCLHDLVMEFMGASPSHLLHSDLLESSLNRPRHLAHYEGADLVRQAAYLAVGISQSQAFEDGNKRAAYAAMMTFLEINNAVFHGDPMDIATRLVAVAEVSAGPGRDERVRGLEDALRRGVTA